MAAGAYASKEGRIEELMTFVLWNRIAFVTLLNGSWSLHLTSVYDPRKSEITFLNTTSPTIFKISVFFYCFAVFNQWLEKNTMTMIHSYRAGTLIDFYVQCLLEAWKRMLSKSTFTDIPTGLVTYMLFKSSTRPFQFLATRSELSSSLLRQGTLVDVFCPLNGEEDGYIALFGRSAETNDALHYVTYLMFNSLRSLIMYCNH